MLKSWFYGCQCRRLLHSALHRAWRPGSPRSRAPGLSASQGYCFGSVSDTRVCLRARSFHVTEGWGGNLDFSQGKAFSLSQVQNIKFLSAPWILSSKYTF